MLIMPHTSGLPAHLLWQHSYQEISYTGFLYQKNIFIYLSIIEFKDSFSGWNLYILLWPEIELFMIIYVFFARFDNSLRWAFDW